MTFGWGPRGQVQQQAKQPLDPALEAEAKEWLTDKEIKDRGGFRSDETKTIYWLDMRQLIEFQKHDTTAYTDIEFWDWFEEFRDTQNIGARRKKVSWRDSIKEYSGGAWTETKNYMTKWWDGAGYGAAGTETTRKLAVAIGAVTTTVSVINDTPKRYRVELAAGDNAEAPTSYTNFDETRVVVSPQALLDTKLEQSDAIEITTGFGLHEGSHIQYTESLIEALTKPSALSPMVVAQRLFNILEDARIESLTGAKYPGFVTYFEKMLAYLWKIGEPHVPHAWGPELGDKLNGILGILRFPAEYEPIARKDTRLAEEYDWFRDWSDRYLEDAITPRQALEEALAHLNEDPETKKQMEEVAKQEKEQIGTAQPGKMSDKDFKNLMKQLEGLLGGKKLETCPSPRHGQTREIKLSPEQSKEIEKLIGSQLQLHDPIVTMKDMYGVGHGPQIISIKPEITPTERQAYRKPSDLVGRMKGAFFFRKAAPMWSDRLLKSGQIDEEEVWRFGVGQFNFFERKMTIDQPDTQITMLVDMSGSMTGERIATAYELANVMLECLRTMKGVRVRVRGHTTGEGDLPGVKGECIVYRLWEPGDPMERLGFIDTLPHRWNYDGFAIARCAQEMVDDQRPREDMVLFVLSDGKPNARGFEYSGGPAMDHVHDVIAHYKQEGVTVVQIAIDPEMRTADQARMFEHWIPFEDRSKLPAQLTKKLIQLFSGE